MIEKPLWETCTGCGKEYAYPHLCLEHRLCGICHPPHLDSMHGTIQETWDR